MMYLSIDLSLYWCLQYNFVLFDWSLDPLISSRCETKQWTVVVYKMSFWLIWFYARGWDGGWEKNNCFYDVVVCQSSIFCNFIILNFKILKLIFFSGEVQTSPSLCKYPFAHKWIHVFFMNFFDWVVIINNNTQNISRKVVKIVAQHIYG